MRISERVGIWIVCRIFFNIWVEPRLGRIHEFSIFISQWNRIITVPFISLVNWTEWFSFGAGKGIFVVVCTICAKLKMCRKTERVLRTPYFSENSKFSEAYQILYELRSLHLCFKLWDVFEMYLCIYKFSGAHLHVTLCWFIIHASDIRPCSRTFCLFSFFSVSLNLEYLLVIIYDGKNGRWPTYIQT